MGWKVPGSNADRRKIFFFSKTSIPVLGFTQSPVKGLPGSLPGVERQGPEANPTPPSSAEAMYLCDLVDETFAFIKIITIKGT